MLKVQEKNFESISEEINSIAKTLPALLRAHKIQKKAAKVGFDFNDPMEAADKVSEELKEVICEYNNKNKDRITNEMGDLLFACVNLGRLLDVNEENALNLANKKFASRFGFIEENILKQGKELKEVSLEELNELWEKAKEFE